MKANQITDILNRIYTLPYQKILINGEWGIGKTKYINDFRCDKKNIYYVSLFGKKNIDMILQELYYEILSKEETNIIVEKAQALMERAKKLDKFEISFYGLNITAPFISDILDNIEKRVVKESSPIIIFDDLERKHQDLDIKEIFGMIDTFSRFVNLRVIIVSALNELHPNDKEDFESYREKAIDKIYTISDFAEDAPEKIVGTEVWRAIKPIYENNSIKNLRTLKKMECFLFEVRESIPESKFTSKFTKKDLIRICYAVVIFVVEHKEKLILLPPKKEGEWNLVHSLYEDNKNRELYINDYILKGLLDNVMCKNLISTILEWFLTGEYLLPNLEKQIDEINAYKSSLYPFYASYETIKENLEVFYDYLENLNGNESLISILTPINELYYIAENMNIPIKYQAEEIVKLISKNIELSIDMSRFEGDYYFDSLRNESQILKEVIDILRTKRNELFHNKILDNIELKVKKTDFSEVDIHDIFNFKNYVRGFINYGDPKLKYNFLHRLKSKGYYLPLPKGEIDEIHWSYCHSVYSLLEVVKQNLGQENILKEAKQYFFELPETNLDKMLKFRLEILFKDINLG